MPHCLRKIFCTFLATAKLLTVLVLANTLVAISNGEESTTFRWTLKTGKNRELTSPIIGPDRTVYVAARVNTMPPSGEVLALNPDGTDKWAIGVFKTPEEIVESSPVLSPDGATLYVGCIDGRLYAVDTSNGRRIGEFDTGHTNHSISCSPAVASDGTIYVGSTDIFTELDSVFYAISPVDLSKLWAVSSSGAIESSPAIAPDGTIYFAGGSQLYSVTKSGVVNWVFPLKGKNYGSPAIGPDGTIYIGSVGDEFVAITPDGKEKWRLAITPGAGASIGADGTIYVGAIEGDAEINPSGKLYALGQDGSVKPNWPVSFSNWIVTVPAIRADGAIIFGCRDKTIRALNPDGSQRWSAGTDDKIETSSPVIGTDGSIYIGSGPNLYALPGCGSPLSEYSSWPMYNRDIGHRSQAAAPVSGGTLVNLATRGFAGPGNPLIAGFVLQGPRSETLLVRAVGPTMRSFVSNPLPDPVLTTTIQTPSSSFVYCKNDDWGSDSDSAAIEQAALRVGAFPLLAGGKDSALLAPFDPSRSYTAVIESRDGGAGVALAELYDTELAPSSPRPVSVSTRGFVGTGDYVLIAGLVIGGSGKLRVLVRGVGPGLSQFLVSGVLPRPAIKVFDEHSAVVAPAAFGKGDLAGAAKLVGAFPLNEASADAAMILSLDPGAYTVQLSGIGSDTGVGLVEVYALPN